jgi:hypothetical protein
MLRWKESFVFLLDLAFYVYVCTIWNLPLFYRLKEFGDSHQNQCYVMFIYTVLLNYSSPILKLLFFQALISLSLLGMNFEKSFLPLPSSSVT